MSKSPYVTYGVLLIQFISINLRPFPTIVNVGNAKNITLKVIFYTGISLKMLFCHVLVTWFRKVCPVSFFLFTILYSVSSNCAYEHSAAKQIIVIPMRGFNSATNVYQKPGNLYSTCG